VGNDTEPGPTSSMSQMSRCCRKNRKSNEAKNLAMLIFGPRPRALSLLSTCGIEAGRDAGSSVNMRAWSGRQPKKIRSPLNHRPCSIDKSF